MTVLALVEQPHFLDKWQNQPEGKRHVEAFASFLATLPSHETKRSYLHTLQLFFDWHQLKLRYCPVPTLVRRSTAGLFVEWLRKGNLREVVEYRMQSSGTALEKRIYAYVKAHPGCGVRSMCRNVAYGISEQQLHELLSTLVISKVLHRWPIIADIREGAVPGLDYNPRGSVIDQQIPNTVYRYYLRPKKRLGKVALHQRLTALASYWTHLADTGENVGESALLTHNIWKQYLKKIRGVEADKIASRVMTTPGLEVLGRALGETYRISHTGMDLFELALAALRGEEDPEPVDKTPLIDLRDRAIMIFLAWTGLRIDELREVRWRDLERDSSGTCILCVVGKGKRTRALSVPSAALAALDRYHAALKDYSEASVGRRRPHAAQLHAPEAPVAAALIHWGVHAKHRNKPLEELRGIGCHALARALRRRGESAGYERGSPEWVALHPHGLRHLAAHWAIERGVPLSIIQQVFGHSSLAITGLYLQEHRPEELTLEKK